MRFGQLLHQYLVDIAAKIESANLFYVRVNYQIQRRRDDLSNVGKCYALSFLLKEIFDIWMSYATTSWYTFTRTTTRPFSSL